MGDVVRIQGTISLPGSNTVRITADAAKLNGPEHLRVNQGTVDILHTGTPAAQYRAGRKVTMIIALDEG